MMHAISLKIRLLVAFMVVAVALAAASCGSSNSPTSPSPAPAPAPAPTPAPAPGPAALNTITFSPSTVVSQGRTVGTVSLTAAAPSGGASVTLSSNNTDVARVSSTVAVAAGSTSNTFNIDVSTVAADTTVTITGVYSGVSKTGTFTVTPPPLEPRFTVISSSKGANACVVDEADGHLDCEFDGSGSFGSISQWKWRLIIAGDNFDQDKNEPKSTLSPPCSFLSRGTKSTTDDSVTVTVELRVVGRNGTTSNAVSRDIKLFRGAFCPQ